MKRQVLSILLFLCFVAPVATSYFVLQVQKKQVRKEVKWKMIAGIDREELVLLKFTEAEKQAKLHWKHSKEFEFDGEMYDIVETQIVGDTTCYWVWWDHEETKLNKQLDNLLVSALGNYPQNKENQKRLIRFFSTLFFVALPQEKHLAFQETTHSIPYQAISYHFIPDPPPVPPPELS